MRGTIVVFFCLFLSLFFGEPARAQQQSRGVSSFAAMHPNFPCDNFLRTAAYAKVPAMTILWQHFGDDPTCMRRFTDTFRDRPHVLQIHYSNESCRRKGSCFENAYVGLGVDRYNRLLEEMSDDTRHQLHGRALWILAQVWFAMNANTRPILSMGLEDQYSDIAQSKLAWVLREIWPYEISRNRHSGGRSTAGVQLLEYHSAHGTPSNVLPCLANEDGNDHSASSSRKFLKRYAKCDVVWLWRKKHQGRKNAAGGGEQNPKLRKFEFPEQDVRTLGPLLK